MEKPADRQLPHALTQRGRRPATEQSRQAGPKITGGSGLTALRDAGALDGLPHSTVQGAPEDVEIFSRLPLRGREQSSAVPGLASTDSSVITGPRTATGAIGSSSFLRPANGADLGARI